MKRIVYIATALLLMACGNNKSRYDAEGNFETDEITVSSEAMGKINALNITEGQQIAADEKVGSIDSVQLYLSMLQLQKSAQSVNSNRPNISKQIAALEEQVKKQKAERLRVQRLLKDGAATSKQLEDVNSQIVVMESQLEAQKSALQNSAESITAQSSGIDMQIAQIKDKLAKCIVRSPVAGTVLAKYAQAGELATVGKPLFKVANLNKVYLRAYITSAQLSKVKLGQKVQVYADFGGDNVRKYTGTVSWISSRNEFTPKNIQTENERENLVYAVKVAVDNDGYIKLGMYGGVKL